MTTEQDDWRDPFLDALIVLALTSNEWQGELPDLPDLDGPEPELSEEDQRALDALGPDLVGRIVRGEWRSRPLQRPKGRARDGHRPGGRRTGTMHRGEAGAELTDKAREEMERKVRELEADGGEGAPP
jgi:hypothetical protein